MKYIKTYKETNSVFIPNEYESYSPGSKSKIGGYIYPIYIGDEKIGKIGLSPLGKDIWIYSFKIYKEFRGHGYSKKALSIIIDRIKSGISFDKGKKQFSNIYLHCDPENEVANNLYKSMGFEIVDYDPNYKNVYLYKIN